MQLPTLQKFCVTATKASLLFQPPLAGHLSQISDCARDVTVIFLVFGVLHMCDLEIGDSCSRLFSFIQRRLVQLYMTVG